MQYRNQDIQHIITALDLILAFHLNRSLHGGKLLRRNGFFPYCNKVPNTLFSLGQGLEARRGFHGATRLAHRQLMINISLHTSIFWESGNLADILQNLIRSDPKSLQSTPIFAKHLRVRLTHLDRHERIHSFSQSTARVSYHSLENREMTVEEYFQKSMAYLNLFDYRD